MKTIIPCIFLTVLFAAAFAACRSDDAKSTAAELSLAVEAGARAATEAMALPAGSYERENAILSIRAKETELRMAGFEECADSFAEAAGRIILPKL